MDLMRTSVQDLAYAARNLRKSPGFTAVAAITLAIGIGANTAIFSIIDTILLRPLPFHNPDRLVRLYETEAAPGAIRLPGRISWTGEPKTRPSKTWPCSAGRTTSISAARGGRTMSRASPPRRTSSPCWASARLLGRTWAPGEDQPGKDQVAVLSYALLEEPFRRRPRRHRPHHRAELARSTPSSASCRPASAIPPMRNCGCRRRWMPRDWAARHPLGQRHRKAETGRRHQGGPGGPDADRAAPREGLPGQQLQGRRESRPAARRPGGRLPRFAAHDAVGGGAGIVDRLRQRGQPAAVAGGGAAEGDGRAQRAGSGPRRGWCGNC